MDDSYEPALRPVPPRPSPGPCQLERALDRSRCDETPLVVAFVEVDGFERLDDTPGLADDAAARAVGMALGTHVRKEDVLLRLGGEQFVCALWDVRLDEAELRFDGVSALLESLDPGTTISVGLALAHPQDGVATVLARARADLGLGRAGRRAQGLRSTTKVISLVPRSRTRALRRLRPPEA